jgi:hypothetical protein
MNLRHLLVLWEIEAKKYFNRNPLNFLILISCVCEIEISRKNYKGLFRLYETALYIIS